MAFDIFGTGRTKMNLDRVKAERAKFVEKGSKRKAGRYGNKEAKRLASEYDAAKQADEVMGAAETKTETLFEDKIRRGRRAKIAKMRSGY